MNEHLDQGKESSIVVLSWPNGPVGGHGSVAELIELLSAARDRGDWIVLDLCYVAFVGDDLLTQLMEHVGDNMTVVASFSKMFGLAGARIGFAVGAPALVRRLRATRIEDHISIWGLQLLARVQDLGVAARPIWQVVRQTRSKTEAYLEGRGVLSLKTGTNFSIVSLKLENRAELIHAQLQRQGYRTRLLSSIQRAPLPGIRFTLDGDRHRRRAFLEVLSGALDETLASRFHEA